MTSPAWACGDKNVRGIWSIGQARRCEGTRKPLLRGCGNGTYIPHLDSGKRGWGVDEPGIDLVTLDDALSKRQGRLTYGRLILVRATSRVDPIAD